jgi:hypothetical protein
MFPIYAHTTVRIGSNLIVYGGLSTGDSQSFKLAILDLETATWRYPEIKGEQPVPVAYHSAISHRGFMLVFGGVSQFGVYTSDIWAWSLQSEQWKKLDTLPDEVNGFPAPRFNHTSAYNGTHWIIYGGVTQTKGSIGDIWSLNLLKMEWALLGFTPTSEQGCSAVIFEKRYLAIGGCSNSGFTSSTMAVFDLVQNQVLAPILVHAAIWSSPISAIGPNSAMIFGTASFRLVKNEMRLVKDGQETMVVFKGDDILLGNRVVTPGPMFFETMNYYGNRLVVIGGKSILTNDPYGYQLGAIFERAVLNEVWEMHLPICTGSDVCFQCSKGTKTTKNEWYVP